MPAWGYVLIAIGALVLVGVAAFWLFAQRRSRRLQSTFSSEYDRTVSAKDDRREAERELMTRVKRRQELEIVPLSPAARERYAERWRRTQAEFVDSPELALRDASALLDEVMSERGYPVADFEEQAGVVSVDHADVVENYRAAHEVSLAAAEGEASTEEMRRAMRHYRSLFEDLLGEAAEAARAPREATAATEEVPR